MGQRFSSIEDECGHYVMKNRPKKLERFFEKHGDVDPNEISVPLASKELLRRYLTNVDNGWIIDRISDHIIPPGAYVPHCDFFHACTWVLHFAAQRNLPEIAKVLIRNGASVNAACKQYDLFSPIHFAASEGHTDFTQLLIQNGARVDQTCRNGFTALQMAVSQNHRNVVKLLIRNGASVNAVNKGSWTALHCAVFHRRVHLIKILIENGADVLAEDVHYNSVLHVAAYMGYANVANMLVRNGADVNEVNEDSYTPLHLCVDRGFFACTLQLVCLGARYSKDTIILDKTGFLRPIQGKLERLRNNKPIVDLFADEEKLFLCSVAVILAMRVRAGSCLNRKAFDIVRSYITFHNIFMAPGFDLGEDSVWRRKVPWVRFGF